MSNATLYQGDCLEEMKKLPDNSVDSVVTDPPYGLLFMGQNWDHGVPGEEYWKEALRVAKPGAHLLAFGGTRTYHRLACAIEDAGWEIRDCIFWCYGCLSDDTEIATPQGWKKRGEIKVGDMVIAFDRVYGKTLSQPVQRVFDYDYDDVAYRLVSPLTNQLVSKNHRILAEVNGVLDFVYAEFLRENDIVRVPVCRNGSYTTNFGLRIGQHEMTTARVSLTHYTGRMWCVSVPSGAIVARRNGKIFVTGNSGFPKSMDVSKAIDKAMGAKRKSRNGEGAHEGNIDFGMKNRCPKCGKPYFSGNPCTCPREDSIPATPEAAAWQGFGTCLKPSCEPIVVARKSLEGTVAANVLKYGTGAINIDGCRVPTYSTGPGTTPKSSVAGRRNSMAGAMDRIEYDNSKGRWPANLIHDGSDEVLSLFPENKGAFAPSKTASGNNGIYGRFGISTTIRSVKDELGSAARFFYCAKASRSERGDFNDHTTVKPVALMRYLVRLVTRKGGLVLDPFMGSGTTGVAALEEGCWFVGVEKDSHYYEIAQRRIGKAQTVPIQGELF